jgi:predicted cobalt transporter CbtA
MRFTQLLRHGATAGAAAGIAAALMLWLVVEPVIRRALVIEEARGAHAHVDGEAPLVSRSAQVVAGGITSALVGVMFGVVFAVVFARIRHRLPGASDHGRSALVATGGFTVFVLLPALKVPANPPAVGDPSTVTERTLLYLLTILLGILAVGVVVAVDRILRGRGASPARRSALDAAAGALAVALILALVPGSPDTIPADVPSDLLWDFRVASLAQLATMWAVLGLVFGVLVEPRTKASRDVARASL